MSDRQETLDNYADNYTYCLIKTYVTKQVAAELGQIKTVSASRQKRRDRALWQRLFWQHLIRDEADFAHHCDYKYLY